MPQAPAQEVIRYQHGSASPFAAAWILASVSLVSLVLVAYFLSCFQVMQRMQHGSVNGKTYSIYRLQRIAEETVTRERGIDALNQGAAITRQKITTTKKLLTELQSNAERLENEQDKLISSIARDLTEPSLKDILGNYSRRRDAITTALNSLANSPGTTPESKAKIDAAKVAFLDPKIDRSIEFNKYDSETSKNEQELRIREDELKIQNAKIEEATKNLNTFGHVFENEKEAQPLMDVVDELIRTKFAKYMTYIPIEMVILAIVILSGLLGSAAFLTHDFVDDTPPRSWGFYALRLLAGMLTSLLLYIVIKAGVIIAVDPRSLSASAADLNAFFVAFVGVVGGLVSGQVIETVMQTAGNWFKGAAIDKQRYALQSLKDALKEETERRKFAGMTGYSSVALDNWLDQDALIPASAQKEISCWLRLPPRDLFTDLPPLAKRNEQSEPLAET